MIDKETEYKHLKSCLICGVGNSKALCDNCPRQGCYENDEDMIETLLALHGEMVARKIAEAQWTVDHLQDDTFLEECEMLDIAKSVGKEF